jgi:uncharacterized protein with ParB-like and HNH nuclease domain
MSNNQTTKALIKEVEEQIKETEKDYDYRLVEWPIEVLMKKFVKKSNDTDYKDLIGVDAKNSVIVVPEYQRDYVWDEPMKAKFIESIFMRVPMPPLFAFELDDEGNLELVDGVQRLSTIKDFTDDKIVLGQLQVLETLNGYKFSELDAARQRKFKNLSLKIYMLDEDTNEGTRADIFNRINSTGKQLQPAEIRKGSYLGNRFYDFIIDSTKLPEFSALFSSARTDEKLRGEKEELVTRFFAYSERYQSFNHSVKGFLDDYIKEKGKSSSDSELKEKREQFVKALNFVSQNFPYGFRKSNNSKSIPRVRFEAISVGVNLAMMENSNLSKPDLKWLESDQFKQWTTSDASNSRVKLIGRVEFVKNCLLGKDLQSLTYGH